MDDIVDEILLRLPPKDPACLVRASAVCRTWRRILTHPAFSGRYRAFHRRTPPLLGVFHNPGSVFSDFVPTTSFRPTIDCEDPLIVFDCRHGRVLMYNANSEEFVVWDPITGDHRRLPWVFDVLDYPWNAAVVCASAAGGGRCDHSGCHGAPFRVAVVGTVGDGIPRACLYSSETGAWSAPTTIEVNRVVDTALPVALVGDALYFLFEFGSGVLRYDMAGRELSVIGRPPSYGRGIALMPADDGGLGFASVDRDNRLRLGFRKQTSPCGDDGWAAPHRTIDLKELLPLGVGHRTPILRGVADGAYAIFANADDDIFIIDLKVTQGEEGLQE